MSVLRSNASLKRKNCVRNSTSIVSEQYEFLSIGLLAKKIRCFGCNRIPDEEIFSCPSGHLICDICKPANDICARAECTKTVERSALAEMFLAEITFKCPWTKLGCTEARIRRKDLTSHKNTCEKNPNLLSCSQLFNNNCAYKFCTTFTDDEDGIKRMKEHLKSHEKDLSVSDKVVGTEKKEENFLIRDLDNINYVTEVLNWTFDGEQLGTFMVVWVVGVDENNMKTISRYFVSLAENQTINKTIEVKLSIKSQPKLKSKIERKFLPDLKWHTTILNTRGFKEILKISTTERILKNYSMHVSHLQNYYVNANDEVNVEFCLHSVELVNRQEKRMRTDMP